ncbi:hypothetical protein CEXT_58242 [Caerostris extrusa]|uniref:DNA mismatch repair protein MutS core domain-containing protein n=1 Tax=Caerostris extrusa TaxID=172846 RepID=A0AAV4MCX3_CAEEX|nr:hypothetical protein CEXT_58242 [Caerostris extrusa]
MIPMISTTAVGTATDAPASRSQKASDSMASFIEAIGEFGMKALEKPQCARKMFCELAVDNIVADSPVIQKAVHLAALAMEDSWLEQLGVRGIITSLNDGTCNEVDCDYDPEGKQLHRHLRKKGAFFELSYFILLLLNHQNLLSFTRINAMSNSDKKYLSTSDSLRNNTSNSKESNNADFSTEADEDVTSLVALVLLLKQAEPCAIVTSCRTDENILNILKQINNVSRPSESTNISFMSPPLQDKLHLLPGIDFALEACRHRLQNLDLPNMPKNMNDVERKIYFSSLIDFTNMCMVKAAGGLLKFINNSPFGPCLDMESKRVSSISTLTLKNVVHIDENSFRALQIFKKKGTHLCICNKCKSAIGKKELKRWFLLPSNDPTLLKERQAAVKYFISSKNADVMSTLQGSLKHIKFLPRIISRMKTAQASMNDWQSLYKTVYHAMLIGEICRSRSSSLEIFNQISVTFSSDLFRIASLLNKIIDFEEYAKQNHFVVKPGVDSELDKMKRTYNGLPDFMTQVAYQELQDLHPDIQQCSVIYLPQLGYLLAIPATDEMKETKNYSIPNLRFMNWMLFLGIHFVIFMIKKRK